VFVCVRLRPMEGNLNNYGGAKEREERTGFVPRRLRVLCG